MSDEERKPNGIYGHWAKQMIEDGLELEDDIDEDLDDVEEYDFGVYGDEEETE